MKVGDRVKLSGYALQSARDWWLGLGDYTRKQAARKYLDDQMARRGVVASAKDHTITVVWDDGIVTHSLDYRVETV